MKKLFDIPYGEHERNILNIYLPDGEVNSVFVYFHGGGITDGSKEAANILTPFLTEQGVCVMSANYRLYPNCKFPDFLCDAAQAVAFAHKYMCEKLGCTKLFVGGSSAGGYISMMLCFDPKYLAAAGIDNSVIAGYYHDAGQPTVHFNVVRERGMDRRRVIIDEDAPLYHIGTAEKYPPMRFIVSDDDMKNRYEQTMLVLKTLEDFRYNDFDHVVMHGTHCQYCAAKDEDGNSVFAPMIWDFIKKVKNK